MVDDANDVLLGSDFDGITAVNPCKHRLAGKRMAHQANRNSRKTGLGEVDPELLLPGGATSLPEAVVSVTSAYNRNAALAVKILPAGVAMPVV